MKTVGKIVAVLLVLLLLIGGFAGSVWVAFSRSAAFADADQGKADIFAGKKVMVIVPHEDDELNLFGGLFEEYLKYGSNVKVVFVTNGDLYLPRETRIREAINALSEVGVTEDNIVFLGYGDGYLYKHLYNAYDGERLISEAGFMETHGADFHPAFIEEHPFTRENYIEDIKACILQEKPDVIFCNDYDSHTDHQAVSLAFEEAMGSILREGVGYQPVVYKGYAYSTAFYAPEDFYSDPNLLSTKNPYAGDRTEDGVYLWSERVRLPVSARSLSRSLYQCSVYRAAKEHESQNAKAHACSVISGDKVFWQRRTDSLCYTAEITVSSGEATKLNDFKLLDNRDLWSWAPPIDGVWIPEKEDAQRQVSVSFPKETTVASLRLYGNPSEEHSVKNARILLSDGTELDTGAIRSEGTEIFFEQPKKITGFTVTLLETEDNSAGLTEIEAYGNKKDEISFLKLMTEEGNFVYDYDVGTDGMAVFALYTGGMHTVPENCDLHCDNDRCSIAVKDGKILVVCPKGEKCFLTVEDPGSGLCDTVRIANPGILIRSGRVIEQIWYEVSSYVMREGSPLSRIAGFWDRHFHQGSSQA